MTIEEIVAKELSLPLVHVANTIKLLRDDNSIPFISRYRKEMTGNMDETKVQEIDSRMKYFEELQHRKATILKTIETQGALTDELSQRILSCWDATELEDIYLPYKPKRRTRAQIARENGLEPLAKILMLQNDNEIWLRAEKFIDNEKVKTVEDAIDGAKDIIAEWVNENTNVRNIVRNQFKRFAVVKSTFVKGKEIEGRNYENYYDFQRPLRIISSHQLLAVRRGESEGFLRVSIEVDREKALDRILQRIIKSRGEVAELVEAAVADSYDRLIKPSIENEFASLSKAKADETAIKMFTQNVRQLLFAPPLGRRSILAIDPGFRTGCKVVCLDKQGNLLHHDVIYPVAPHHDVKGATETITRLVEKYRIEAFALGNGTASRETESFLKRIKLTSKVPIHVVSENGASIYSASKVAREEFPNEDVTVRGAVSIGRRLLDPLAELVKIDPKSIGVGQYQHDVDQTKLKNALDFTVESCVNSVGVNVNTASKELLTYVSGLGPALAQNIVTYRAENGDFTSRAQLLKVPKLGPKTFTQAAGFIRVPESDNPLDNSSVHPERYKLVEQMAKDCGCNVAELISNKEKRQSIELSNYVNDEVGEPTLKDIMRELEKPGRDPRSTVSDFEFDENIQKIEDLKVGMELSGKVTNITQFGAFVDVGVHREGLVHVSQISDKRLNDPSSVLKIAQHVRVKVIGIDIDRGRISLSMKSVQQP